jgi:hypothetical protein
MAMAEAYVGAMITLLSRKPEMLGGARLRLL